MQRKQFINLFIILIFIINIIDGIEFNNCPTFDKQGNTVIEFINNTECDTKYCYWPFENSLLFYYNITIKPDRDIYSKQIDKIFIMSDSMNSSYTYTNWFCSVDNKYNENFCPMKQSSSYNVHDGIYILTDNFKPNTYLDVIQTYSYQDNGAPTNLACIQYKAYLYDENECQKNSIQTLLNNVNQTYKKLRSLILEMSNLFTEFIEMKINYIELFENQLKTLMKNKHYPFFCPDFIHYQNDYQQFQNKLKLENITKISQDIVHEENLKPLIDYLDEIIDYQSKQIKQLETDKKYLAINIIQKQIFLLNTQIFTLKSFDLLNGELKRAQQLITSTFLLIEELQMFI
uniref:Uncharacterized protein LOC113796503 n=1 Tax=Dermatophagoides pteronyssinus TaxID=6956 RepID=A0A6P6YAW9_DERPT|nr:uncharacterized protein LOC113796503 [Dermatophagoides pteronyssinus]